MQPRGQDMKCCDSYHTWLIFFWSYRINMGMKLRAARKEPQGKTSETAQRSLKAKRNARSEESASCQDCCMLESLLQNLTVHISGVTDCKTLHFIFVFFQTNQQSDFRMPDVASKSYEYFTSIVLFTKLQIRLYGCRTYMADTSCVPEGCSTFTSRLLRHKKPKLLYGANL